MAQGSKVKTAVLTGGQGVNLQAVLDTRYFGEIPGMELAMAIAPDPDCFALERARLAGIPACAIQREIFPNEESFHRALKDRLEDLDTELVVLADWPWPLPEPILRRWSGHVLALHPALLPLYGDAVRTPEEIQRLVLESGAQTAGATACLLEPDGLPGPVLLQRPVPVLPGDTPEKLLRRITEEAERLLLPEALAMVCSGRLCVRGRQTFLLPVMEDGEEVGYEIL